MVPIALALAHSSRRQREGQHDRMVAHHPDVSTPRNERQLFEVTGPRRPDPRAPAALRELDLAPWVGMGDAALGAAMTFKPRACVSMNRSRFVSAGAALLV